MNPVVTIIIGLLLIVGGIGVSIATAALIPGFSLIFWGAPIAGLFMIGKAVWNILQSGRCRMGTNEDGSRLPIVFVPIKKVGRAFGGEIPEYLMYLTDQQRVLADIIYNDLQHEERYHTSGVPPWDITKWRDISVLRDDKGNISHLCVLFDDGTIPTGDYL